MADTLKELRDDELELVAGGAQTKAEYIDSKFGGLDNFIALVKQAYNVRDAYLRGSADEQGDMMHFIVGSEGVPFEELVARVEHWQSISTKGKPDLHKIGGAYGRRR